MSSVQKSIAGVLALLLAAAVYGLWITDEPAVPARAVIPAAAGAAAKLPVIDEQTYLTAQRLARLARTNEGARWPIPRCSLPTTNSTWPSARAVAEAIQKQVVAATKDSTQQAEQEWQRASHGQRGSSLSAEPGIAVRPISGGVEIAVRYLTKASERYALRARL